jgi:hypothetical protein
MHPKESEMSKSWLPIVILAAFVASVSQPAGAQTGALHARGPQAANVLRPAAIRQSFTCVSDAFTMCLNGGRFEVVATFDTGQGQSGSAEMVRLTDDSGYMWFFNSTNIEVVIKVLNACALNNAYWVFAGGLTNVQVLITVTDSITGAFVQYQNPLNTTYQPIQDTNALDVCP